MSNWKLRAALPLALIFAYATQPAAAAAAVSIAPVTISPTLQKALQDRYGVDEAKELQKAVTQSLSRSLKGVGAETGENAPVRIEVAIVSAAPTHPTRRQMRDNPSLDYLRTVYKGGADLHAVLRDAKGQVLDKVAYNYEALTIHEASMSGGAWGDAHIAIDRFADQVAKAYKKLSAAKPAS